MATDRRSPREFLAAPATAVAADVLGATIVSDLGGGRVAVRLTEVEAYEGPLDPASHAYRGPTARNSVMFGPAGHLYVYFVYGMHWCANVVCGPDGTASALLLRAGRVTDGLALARARRPAARAEAELARGPARLARCLGLSRSDNGLDLVDRRSPVRLVLPGGPGSHQEVSDGADVVRPAQVVATGPRVGVATARAEPLRFWLDGDPTVSTYRPRTPPARRAGVAQAPRRADWPA